eukprot:scaffold26258_cov60-Phaeocystis_antarctica.AAC.2
MQAPGYDESCRSRIDHEAWTEATPQPVERELRAPQPVTGAQSRLALRLVIGHVALGQLNKSQLKRTSHSAARTRATGSTGYAVGLVAGTSGRVHAAWTEGGSPSVS